MNRCQRSLVDIVLHAFIMLTLMIAIPIGVALILVFTIIDVIARPFKTRRQR